MRHLGRNSGSVGIDGGNLSVDSSCKVSGAIQFEGCNTTFIDAQMAGDKFTFNGVGKRCADGNVNFTAIRR